MKILQLFTLYLFQTCMSFFLLLNTKKMFWRKSVNKQLTVALTFIALGKNYYVSRWLLSTIWLQAFFKSSLCSAEERNSFRFGTSGRSVNNDRSFIFGWTVPLMYQWYYIRKQNIKPGKIAKEDSSIKQDISQKHFFLTLTPVGKSFKMSLWSWITSDKKIYIDYLV